MDDLRAPVILAVSTVILALEPAATGGRGALRIPLVRRIREPHEGRWALPGGPLRSDESLVDAAARSLDATTGLRPEYLEQLYAFGDPDRSAAAHDRVVSVVYWALVRAAEADTVRGDDNVRWFPADDLPELAFDHAAIIEYALGRVRTKMTYAAIAHTLLGETFTLAQLREVYEAVLGTRLDPANFRRQVEASGEVEPTGETLPGGRHRPPRLYRQGRGARPAQSVGAERAADRHQ